MKIPIYLKNIFAGLGVISLIFYTCAATEELGSNDNNSNNPVQISGDVYQVECVNSNDAYNQIVVLNKETGVMKSYFRDASVGYEWVEGYNQNFQNTGSITFTHWFIISTRHKKALLKRAFYRNLIK